MKITGVEPTVFLKHGPAGLLQLVRITVDNSGGDAETGEPASICADGAEPVPPGMISRGIGTHEIFLPERTSAGPMVFTLTAPDGRTLDTFTAEMRPARHWTVHVVQNSHHDPGYTDLPSRVLKLHDRWIDEAIDTARETDGYEDDAKFRIVIEQAWSIVHFLRNAPADRAAAAIDLIRQGRFEVTALFGNMTTELCGHEEMARLLYPAFELKRLYGFEIVSAEHNDITGMSWGLSTILTEAGIKIFCPGLPLYYSWGGGGMPSFWDQRAIFGHDGPGAFWWEAPSGKRVLMWCNNSGCGGDCRGNMPGLAGKLAKLEAAGGYPYSVIRWPVSGAAGDNSPYIPDYAHNIREWNEKWAFPHLICSTDAKFYADFVEQIPADLPVHRGELAGQDYPMGASCLAGATSVNRGNHFALPAAETMASLASLHAGLKYPAADIADAYEEMLWYDEHAWGFHFPCGPAARTSELEKSVHAWRASALTHAIGRKALARLADNIKKDEEGALYLTVFNTTQHKRTGPVRALLREFDNACTEMYRVPPEQDHAHLGYLRWKPLNTRWQDAPPPDFIEAGFTLSDISTGSIIPFQIEEISSAAAPITYAAERSGVGSGTKRYGFFEEPTGLKRDLCFIAADVPAFGWRTYKLTPGASSDVARPDDELTRGADFIENKYYRITADPSTGAIKSIFDKGAGRELVDETCRHGFNSIVVRDETNRQRTRAEFAGMRTVADGPVCAVMESAGSAFGHPSVVQAVRLYAGVKKIYFDTRVLKDATPLLNVHIAFPFKTRFPRFRYEGTLSALEPIVDHLPGSQTDTIAVQNWVSVSDGDYRVLWSSLDAPIAGFGDLWPGYTSPAHSGYFGKEREHGHEPLKPEDLKNGWIYSVIFSNNYGTNFFVSQPGDTLFRYVLTTAEGGAGDAAAAAFGREATEPLDAIFTTRNGTGMLPQTAGTLEIDNENVTLLTLKRAEDGNGHIIRLWNRSDDAQTARIKFTGIALKRAITADITEAETGPELEMGDNGGCFTIDIAKHAVSTFKLI